MKSRSLLLVFTVGVLLAVATIQALDLRWLRQRTTSDAEQRATHQARAVAEYIRRSFVAADSSLRQLAIHSRRIGGPTAPSADWLPILEAAQAALAEEGSLSVTDENGIIRHTTLERIRGDSRRDTYLFQHFRQHDADELVLDVPFISPVAPDRWIVPVGRRLTDDRGRFVGTVVQVITPESFRPFFESLRLGTAGTIRLFHPDGKVIVQQPPFASLPDAAAPTDPLFGRIGPDDTGVVWDLEQPSGARVLSAYRRLHGPDLIVAVSLSEVDFLADWRARRRRSAGEFLGLAGLMSVMVVVVLRQVRARSGVEQALTEVQRTEAARLRDANERLESALERERDARHESEAASRLKDEFLMTLSHELRTPLNAILGWLHLLRADAVAADQRAHALATIERNAQAQARLIEDLLDVSRAVSGKLTIVPRPTDVGEVVRDVTATLEPAVAARAIQFHAEVEAGLPRVNADPDRLQQVVWNLLSNAIKFSTPGSRVHVAVRQAASGIEIVVEDSGIGIPPAFLPFVFDRFRQADAGPRRERGGLGLGLAIARHLVELHGGTITAESDGDGQGATFRVTLPISPA